MAMENGSLSASDVALLSRNDGCCYNNGFGFGNGGFEGLIYLAVIASMFGGGGWGNWGNRGDGFANAIGYQNLATQNDVQRGFDNQNSMSNQREILTAVTNGTAQTIAASTANASNAITAIKDGNAALIREFGNVETALTALSGQQRECCCDIKQLIQAASANTDAQIAASKYETAMQLAGMEQRITSKMDQNEITSLRDQVQQLQLAQATAGVLRFPNQWSYGAGPFPPIFGGCSSGCCGSTNI